MKHSDIKSAFTSSPFENYPKGNKKYRRRKAKHHKFYFCDIFSKIRRGAKTSGSVEVGRLPKAGDSGGSSRFRIRGRRSTVAADLSKSQQNKCPEGGELLDEILNVNLLL